MKKACIISLLLNFTLIFSACGATTSTYQVAPNNKTNVSSTTKAASTPTLNPIATPVPEDGYKSDGKLHVYIVGEGEKLFTSDSSFIKYIIYYPESKHMIINMSDKDYAYANVSKTVWNDLLNASSIDSFYSDRIKNHSEYLLNGYVSGKGDDIVIEYIDNSVKIVVANSNHIVATPSPVVYSFVTPKPSTTYSYTYSTSEYTYCDGCGKYLSIDDLYYVESSNEYFCESCIDYFGFDYCEGCGEMYSSDDMYGDDGSYCWSCWEEYGSDSDWDEESDWNEDSEW